jgi:hypothetical protein
MSWGDLALIRRLYLRVAEMKVISLTGKLLTTIFHTARKCIILYRLVTDVHYNR